MWLKNATVRGINPKFIMSAPVPAERQFIAPLDHEFGSSGWAPVFEGAYMFALPGHTLLYFLQEKKTVPASAVKRLAAARAAEMEKEQGFAPGKKMMKELRERITDELPRALSSQLRTAVWIDREKHRVVIDSTSNATIEAVEKLLTLTFPNLGLQDVSWPRAQVVTEWMFTEPEGFTVDDEVSLAYPGEAGKTVKFKAANLAGQDVLEHIQKGGAKVETLAMTFDSRMSFVMTDNCQLRRLKALDVLRDQETTDVDRFTNDFTLMTLETGRLIDAVIAEA